MDQACSVDS